MPKRQQPETVEDNLSNEELIGIVAAIRRVRGGEKQRVQEAERTYPDFKVRYPFLFDMVCGDNFDERMFAYMLAMRSRVADGQMTNEQASAKVGQDLYNQYVAPVVAKTPGDKNTTKIVDAENL